MLAKVDGETVQYSVVDLRRLGDAGLGGPGQEDLLQREAVAEADGGRFQTLGVARIL